MYCLSSSGGFMQTNTIFASIKVLFFSIIGEF